jgi:hypothetical protein
MIIRCQSVWNSAEKKYHSYRCVLLLCWGGVFQNKVEAKKISNIFKNKSAKLEALYSKLEHPKQKKKTK